MFLVLVLVCMDIWYVGLYAYCTVVLRDNPVYKTTLRVVRYDHACKHGAYVYMANYLYIGPYIMWMV
jgi:hypothetical protein